MSNDPDKPRRWWGWPLGCLCLCLVPVAVVLIGEARYRLYHDANIVQSSLADLKSRKTTALTLDGTRNTDWVVEQVRGMPEIEHVFMMKEHITVAGMRHLGTLPNLKAMVVYSGGPGICDEGMLELRHCKKLERLMLLGAPISDKAIQELKRAVPNVRVSTVDDD